MIHDKNILKTPPVWMGLIAIFTMISCGTYEYSGYDRDGIYASDPETAYAEPTQPKNEQPIETDDAGYYENYFGQEAQKIEQAQNMIFTDVDAYSSNHPDSTYNEEEEMYYEEGVAYNAGNAAWGSNPTEINVNYYNTGYNPYYYGGWSNFAWRFGYVGSSFFFGWHTPYYGYYNPYYYGYGYYNPYYYGYGYGYNPYYYNPYYSRIAHNRNYRNGNRSSYNREAARNRNGNRSSYNRENARSRDAADGRNNRTTRSRVRNPRSVNANAARRNTNVRTRSTNTRENTRSNTRTRTKTSRDDNATRSSTRSSSQNNSGNVRKSTRSYSPPARTRSTGTRSSSRGSSRRGGR